MYSEGIFVGGRSAGDVFDQTANLDSCEGRSDGILSYRIG